MTELEKSSNFFSRWSQRKMLAREHEAETDAPVEPVVADVQPSPLTLDDVAALAPDADFAPFMNPIVDETVKRAAMKKLFSDPHFNVMDGLDTYIEDFNLSEPIPESMLRQMVQSQTLGLFDESTSEHETQSKHEDTDLRLQSHDAAGHVTHQPGAELNPRGDEPGPSDQPPTALPL